MTEKKPTKKKKKPAVKKATEKKVVVKDSGKKQGGRGNPPIETRFKPGVSGNPKGKPKGTKNRATIARQVLSMKGVLPQDVLDKLKKVFPDINNNMTVEEIMTIKISGQAISKGDVASYKAIMDSGYGNPNQAITGKDGKDLFPGNPYKDLSDEEIDELLEKSEKENGE